jgi:transposase-like protein
MGNFGEAIISLYTRGLSTREIEQHVKEIYGVHISPQFVSRVTEELQQQIVEWQNRPLDRVYPVVFVDGLRVSVRSDKGVVKKCVYTVLGVDIDGRQEVLGLWIEETEGARFWLKVFNDPKARGVEDAIIVCGDGLAGLRNAVESVYPQADVQLCVIHHIRNVTKFVSWKDRQALCAGMPLDREPLAAVLCFVRQQSLTCVLRVHTSELRVVALPNVLGFAQSSHRLA